MIQKVLKFLTDILRFHKKKIGTFLFSALLFFVLLFPLGDLADLVSSLISKSTSNSVFLYFNDLGIALFPAPGLIMNEVTVDLTQFSSTTAASLKITPNLASLLAFRLGVRVAADQLFKGDLVASYRQGAKIPESTQRMQNVDVDGDNLDLNSLQKFFSLPVELHGLMEVSGEAEVDPTFKIQPKGDAELTITKFRLPASTLMIPMAGTGTGLPVNLPEIKVSQVEGVTRLDNGDLQIESLKFGDGKDVLKGRIKGRMAINFRSIGGLVRPEPGSYDLKIELDLKRERPSELNLMFAIIPDRYKAATSDGQRYAFRITGSGFNAPPKFADMGGF